MNPPINSHSTETEKRETILPHPELKKDGSSILLSLSLSLSLSVPLFIPSFLPGEYYLSP